MVTIQRGKILYYVKDEVVVVGINALQYIAYTVYPLQNRKPFYDFRKAILNSDESQYGTIVEHIQLAKRYGLKAVSSRKPKEVEI